MADIKKAAALTGAQEKGYANNSRDKGGETYAAVARVFHPLWAGWPIVDATKEFLGLTDTVNCGPDVRAAIDRRLGADPRMAALVSDLLKGAYWDTLHLDDEPDQDVADKAFDIAVNLGVGAARSFLLEARRAA